MKTLRILVLANPISGHGHARRRAPQLADALRARGHQVELHMTRSTEDLLERTATASPATLDLLLIAGGDGSLGTAVDHLPDLSLPVGLLPCGTANSMARELRLPRRPAALAALVDAGHCTDLRVGEAVPDHGEARRFLCFAGVGLDAAMVHELERGRRGTLGRLRWFPPVLRVVRHLPDHHLNACFDDGEELSDLSEVLAARIRDFGSVFRLPPAVDPAGDDLVVLVFSHRRHGGWIRTALRGWLLGLQSGRDCELRRCQSVRITSGDIPGGEAPVQADGDGFGHAPVTLRLTDRRLRLLVPPTAPGARPTLNHEDGHHGDGPQEAGPRSR